MSWFFLSFFAAFVYALVNMIDKVFLVHYVRSTRAIVGIMGLFSFLFFIIFEFIYPIKLFQWQFFAALLLSGIFEAIYIYYYFKAIQDDHVAYLIPLFGLGPLISLIVSFLFFHKSFQLSEVMGALAIIVGIFILVVARFGPQRLKLTFSFWCMVVAATFSAFQGLAIDYAGNSYSGFDALAISRLGVGIGALFIVLCCSGDLKSLFKFRNYVFFFPESLNILAAFLFIVAITKGSSFYVLSVTSIQPLIVLFLSFVCYKLYPKLLQEDFSWYSKKLAVVSITLTVLGTIFI